MEKYLSTLFLPLFPIPLARFGFLINSITDLANRSGLWGSTNRPVLPCSTTSATPSTAVATTGFSAAIASNMTMGNPSHKEESAKISKVLNKSGTSFL